MGIRNYSWFDTSDMFSLRVLLGGSQSLGGELGRFLPGFAVLGRHVVGWVYFTLRRVCWGFYVFLRAPFPPQGLSSSMPYGALCFVAWGILFSDFFAFGWVVLYGSFFGVFLLGGAVSSALRRPCCSFGALCAIPGRIITLSHLPARAIGPLT